MILEISKYDNSVPIMAIIKKMIANEKISVPRLDIFEKIAPATDND